MKLNKVFIIIILSIIGMSIVKAEWYDTYLNLYIAIDCDAYAGDGAGAGATPDDRITSWINDTYDNGRCSGVHKYPEPVSFSDACPILEADPSGAFILYNDLVRISECPGDWGLFPK